MTSFRRRLRLWAVACLVFQAASLAAFVPRSCCAAHDHAAARGEATCHEPPPADACPMHAEDGASCPMHAAAADPHAGHTGAAPAHDATCCVLRGACDGPPLFTLLVQPAILTAPTPALAPAAARAVAPVVPARTHSLVLPPDAPPPRA